MFSVKSLGIKEKFSDYDQEQLDKFNREVSFSDGKYYVALPWNDCIGDVPSNFNVCKSILFRVADNLRKNNLFVLWYVNVANFIVTVAIPLISLICYMVCIPIYLKKSAAKPSTTGKELQSKSTIEWKCSKFYTPRIRNGEIRMVKYVCRNNNNERCPLER